MNAVMRPGMSPISACRLRKVHEQLQINELLHGNRSMPHFFPCCAPSTQRQLSNCRLTQAGLIWHGQLALPHPPAGMTGSCS